MSAELITGLITLATGVIGYFFKQKAANKDAREIVDDLVTELVEDALDNDVLVGNVQSWLEEHIISFAKKHKLTLPRPIVNIAIAWGVVEFKQRARARKANKDAAAALPGQLDAVASSAAKVVEAFTPKGIVPKLEMDVEIVP